MTSIFAVLGYIVLSLSTCCTVVSIFDTHLFDLGTLDELIFFSFFF